MFEFDLQRFNDDAGQETSADVSQETQAEEQPPIPEELSGLPEEYAREVLSEAEQSQAETQTEEPQTEPSEEPKPQTPSNIPYARFKEKVDEVNQLKAQLAEYQHRQQPAPQPQPPQQPQRIQQPQFRITPEVSKRISEAITAEALALTGMSQDDVASLEYADDDDPRIAQWNQGKSIAQARVYNAIQQAQINQQQQAQQFFADQSAAINIYNDFAAKAMSEADHQAVVQFATNEFFEKLTPIEQKAVASAYIRVERQTASLPEMLLVKEYYEKARAAFRTRGAKKQSAATNQKQRAQQAATLPRVDQLNGTATTNDGQLSPSDVEKIIQGDMTKLDEKTLSKFGIKLD